MISRTCGAILESIIFGNFSQKFNGPFNRILSTFRTHMNRGTNGEMQSQHFKLLLSFVLEGVKTEYEFHVYFRDGLKCRV